jgi:hypothetical protein
MPGRAGPDDGPDAPRQGDTTMRFMILVKANGELMEAEERLRAQVAAQA